MAGLSQAWNGIAGAASAITGGQGLGAAGQSLASGFSPTSAYSAANAAAGGAGVLSPTEFVGPPDLRVGQQAGSTPSPMPTASGGFLSSPLAQAAAIQGVSSVVGAVGQAKMAEAQMEREKQLAEEERQRRNRNMGVLFDYGSPKPEGYYRPSSFVLEFNGGAR
jgi:hypothetical protein